MRYTIFLACLFFLSFCGNRNSQSEIETANVTVDESFRPMIETASDVFESQYRKAHLSVAYRAESDAIADMLKGKTQMVIASRKLRPDEEAMLKKKLLRVVTVKVAVDAVAVIANPQSADSMMTLKRFEEVMRGNAKNKAGEPLVLVFDNKASSNLHYIREYFKLSPKDSVKFFAARSNQDVIEHVAKNKNAIGMIGVNWVSDVDNKTNQRFLTKVRVVPISPNEKPESPEEYYMPDQYNLHKETYPFRRDVYAVSCEIGLGPASHFITFLRGEKGQRIVQKEGLLPAAMPVRFVEVK